MATQLSIFDFMTKKAENDDIYSALSFVMGDSFVSDLRSIFFDMEIAEEEIAKGIKLHPDKEEKINGCFLALKPPILFEDYSRRVYRVHCAELVERAALGQKLDPATDAECMVLISQASLQAPPIADYANYYLTLFKKWFPDDYEKHVIAKVPDYRIYASTRTAFEEIRMTISRRYIRR